MPILPTLLVNGTYGIGTGWSTFVPPHDPLVVADHVQRLVRGESVEKTPLVYPTKGISADVTPATLKPWVRGSHGSIERVADSRGVTYRSYGFASRPDRTTLEVRELPYGTWTDEYKKYLIRLCEKDEIKDFSENHSHNGVFFTITGSAQQIDALYGGDESDEIDGIEANAKRTKRRSKRTKDADSEGTGWDELRHNHRQYPHLYKKMKLQRPLSMRNMHAFDSTGRIKHYLAPEDICEDHFPVRLAAYTARKEVLERRYRVEVETSSNKSRFVRALLSGELKMLAGPGRQASSQGELVRELMSRGYASSESLQRMSLAASNSAALVIASPADLATNSYTSNSYSYLLDMPIASLTEDRVHALEKSAAESRARLKTLTQSSNRDLWMHDLDAFVAAYSRYKVK